MPTAHADLLRAADLRVTAPRLAVLAEVEAHQHATAESIRQAVRDRLGTVSTQAVYDVLGALTRARILRRIEPSGSAGRYELYRGDNHHHVVCRECGAIHDVPCAVGQAPCLSASDDHGFDIEAAEVIYWGTCSACQVKADTVATAPAPGMMPTRHLPDHPPRSCPTTLYRSEGDQKE